MSKLEYINWGVASRVGNTVFLNKRLKYYRKLKNALIRHEKAHTEDFSMRDILLDLDLQDLKGVKKEYYKFIVQNPTAWVEFLPIKKYGDVILFNLPLLFIWFFAGAIAWAIITSLI